RPTGADGVVTMADVKKAAAEGSAPLGAPAPAARREAAPALAPAPIPTAAPAPSRAAPAARAEVAYDVDEPIRGVRRNMVRSMSQAHAEVVPTSLMDDADINAWA